MKLLKIGKIVTGVAGVAMYVTYRLNLYLTYNIEARNTVERLGDISFGLFFVFLAFFLVSGIITVGLWINKLVKRNDSEIGFKL